MRKERQAVEWFTEIVGNSYHPGKKKESIPIVNVRNSPTEVKYLLKTIKQIFLFDRRHCVAVIYTHTDENTGLFLAVSHLPAESGKGTSCCN